MSNNYHKGLRVRHSIPGRLRVRIVAILYDENKASTLRNWLANQAEGINVEARPLTGSVILYYNPERIKTSSLLRSLDLWLKENQGPTSDRESLPDSVHRVYRSEPKKSLLAGLIQVIALTGFMAFVLIRKLILKTPVPQGPFSLVAVVAVVGAIPLIRKTWKDLRRGRYTSLFPFLTIATFLAIFLGESLAALEVIWILRIGMLLEDYVTERSRKAIREILHVAAKNTFILVEGIEVEVPVAEVRVNDTVVLHTGEKIPVDGMVTEGEALVDEAPITGRAEPEVRRVGERVFAGTIVQQGRIFIRAEKVGDETYLSRILYLVEESLSNKAPAEKRADILASRLMRLGGIATIGTLIVTLNPIRAFTVMLVMACPCATVLAASTAVTASIANAARNHILIKGGLYLEHIGEADCFCFDKTGTLTTEVPSVSEIVPGPRQNPDRILSLAATAEAHNQHALARALIKASSERNITPERHAVCEFILGRGVRARLGKNIIRVGNDRFMDEEGVNIRYFRGRTRDLIEKGYTVVYVARNGRALGMIGVTNTVREDAMVTLDWLRNDGVKSQHLITGDAEIVARAMAKSLGFDDYRAELPPDEKARYVKELKDKGQKVVMVGDGVNDALALAQANIGIAMGAGGSEVAIEAADITLVDNGLERLVALRQLSRQTIRVIEQNHWMAISTNLIGTILGAAGWFSPLMGGVLHVVHTLGILLNSGRLVGWEAPGLSEQKEINQHD
ncbi:MAG: heavy metal translocating P-type ATPase [Thermodesulfovibrionales bacterium]|nr:heavy metal translocating P-type ATPase [Thermodesulfovibrionales bacterium]